MTQITQFLRRAVQTNGKDVATVCGERTQTWHQFAGSRRPACRRAAGAGLRGRATASASWRSTPTVYLEAFFGLGDRRRDLRADQLPGSRRPRWSSGWPIAGCTGLLIDDAFCRMLPTVAAGALRPAAMSSTSATAPTPAGAARLRGAGRSSGAGRRCRPRRQRRSAGIFYTGGTTGTVQGRHAEPRQPRRQRAERARARSAVDAGTVYLHAAPMFHLADGAATFARRRWPAAPTRSCRRFDPAAVLQTIASAPRHRTRCWCRP